MNILFVKLSAIGDVVQTLPALEAIKGVYPSSVIDWVVEEASAGILEGHPLINRLLISRRKAWLGQLRHPRTFAQGCKNIQSFLRELHAVSYDIAIDFQGLLKSGVIMCAARAERKIGFEGTREFSSLFLNERLPPYDVERHALERYLDVARYLGAKDPSPACKLPIDAERDAVSRRLAPIREASRRIVVVNPVARWTTKLWNEAKFAELADRIVAEMRSAVVFTGSSADRVVIERIRSCMVQPAENWAGTTSLKELAALAALADVFISTDTGPMHIAAAAGARVLALFGPTAPWRTGPFGSGHVVVRSGIACSPCFRKKCDHISCMQGIEVGDVAERVTVMLAELGS